MPRARGGVHARPQPSGLLGSPRGPVLGGSESHRLRGPALGRFSGVMACSFGHSRADKELKAQHPRPRRWLPGRQPQCLTSPPPLPTREGHCGGQCRTHTPGSRRGSQAGGGSGGGKGRVRQRWGRGGEADALSGGLGPGSTLRDGHGVKLRARPPLLGPAEGLQGPPTARPAEQRQPQGPRPRAPCPWARVSQPGQSLRASWGAGSHVAAAPLSGSSGSGSRS